MTSILDQHTSYNPQWKQAEDGTIVQTATDKEDVTVDIFSQTAAEWNQKIRDDQNPPQAAEIVYLEQPVIHTGFFGYIKNWLGIV